MRDFSTAKWSYITRRVSDPAERRLGGFVDTAHLGDLVVARVAKIGTHDRLEDVHGRRVRLYTGDLFVGAYGNRYATDFYEGYIAPGRIVHLLTAGGLIGRVASAHARRGDATELEVLGPLTDADGGLLSLDRFVRPPTRPAAAGTLGTLVVLGSSMSAGKTTTAAAIVRGWARAGLLPGAGKVTGSGSGKDLWSYVDAGAAAVADFLDFGMSSTFGYPIERLRRTMVAIRDALFGDGANVAVLEIADGLLQAETRLLASSLPAFADGVVLAVADALGAVAGVKILDDLSVPVRAISGLVTASPLASREAVAATGLPVLSPVELAEGAAVDLLVPERTPA